jgi:periplasmic protein TonB
MSVTIRMIGCAVALAATASLGPAQAQQSEPRPIDIAPTTTDLTPAVPRAVQAWENQVSRLLLRSKRFPPEARKLGQEGSVRLQFSLDRRGAVTSSQIVLSSGYELLDNEALQMLQRAQPFPPAPPELTGEQIFLRVPITFRFLRPKKSTSGLTR